MKKLFILLFIATSIFSQKLPLKGKIVDKETKKPIEYANISFLKKDIGTSSSEFGHYLLMVDEKLLSEKVYISCLNYEDTIIKAKELRANIIQLKPKRYVLKEVVISKKKSKKIVLDKVKKRIIPMHSGNIKMIAKYFPNNLNDDLYFDNIKIHFSRRNSQKAKFRVRIFSIDSITGKPKEDLLLKSIPISIGKEQKQAFLDLENFYIEVPKKGFFIAFEKLFIPENEYTWNNHKNEKVLYYSPVIGVTKSKEFLAKNCKTYLYNKGFWFLSPKVDKKDRWVPAISVTLSN